MFARSDKRLYGDYRSSFSDLSELGFVAVGGGDILRFSAHNLSLTYLFIKILNMHKRQANVELIGEMYLPIDLGMEVKSDLNVPTVKY